MSNVSCYVTLMGIWSGECVEIIYDLILSLNLEVLSDNISDGSVLYRLIALYMSELFKLSGWALCVIQSLCATLLPIVFCIVEVIKVYSA